MMRKAVIYEDNEIIALNKPSGIPVQGGTKSQEKNIDRFLSVLRKNVCHYPVLRLSNLDEGEI